MLLCYFLDCSFLAGGMFIEKNEEHLTLSAHDSAIWKRRMEEQRGERENKTPKEQQRINKKGRRLVRVNRNYFGFLNFLFKLKLGPMN